MVDDHQSDIHPLRTWIFAVLFLIFCLGFHWSALLFIDRVVSNYPTVPDVLMDRLPLVTFGVWGELFFVALFALFAYAHFRYNWRATPRVLFQVGLVYFIRALFLIFIPIGPPSGSVPASERISVWGFANHAYFPGGHAGVLSAYAMNLPLRRLRPLYWALVIIFLVGTILNKNHYTADAIGGFLVGMTAVRWGGAAYDHWFRQAEPVGGRVSTTKHLL